jgi:two-component system response regulator FixJ
MDPQTVLIIDGDVAARDAIARLAGVHGCHTQSFSSPEPLLSDLDSSTSGCILSELRFDGCSGLDLLDELKNRDCSLPVIIVTAHADVPTAVNAMLKGAFTLLQKPYQDEELWSVIEAALRHEREHRALRQELRNIRLRLAALAPGAVDVLRGLLQGKPNKKIAADLGIGLRTVELRRARLLQKMEAGSLAELVRMVTIAEFPISREPPECAKDEDRVDVI